MDDLNALLHCSVVTKHGVGPQAEACKVGGDARHLEGNRLKRCVTPRLIIRRIDAEVVAENEVIIALVQHAVVAGEVARHKDELHAVVLVVAHAEPVHHAEHTVTAFFVQTVCGHGVGQRCVEHLGLALQTLHKVGACFLHPCRHLDEGDDLLLEVMVEAQTVDALHEHVDALVAHLVTSACRHDHGVVIIEGVACQGVGHAEDQLACFLALLVKLALGWHKRVVETVGQHHVYGFVEQLSTLAGCDVAHGGEAVDILGCLLLYRLLALHVKLLRHLVAVVACEIFVERLVVACDASADACGMGCEHRGDLRQTVVDVEDAETCHPLVAVIDDVIVGGQIKTVIALCHACSSVREH